MVEFSNLGLLENQSIIKLNVSTIQSITDNLPNSGALTDIAQIVNQSVIVANQSTILDSLTTDATASNQTAIVANQTLISDDIDITIANTSTLLNNLSSGEIGDATLVNQSTILDSLGTDATAANQSIIITNQSTILDTVGSDASAANQTAILANQTSISDNLGLTLANTSTILDTSYGDATISNQSTILQNNQTIDGNVDTIQAVTDLLPDAGALTSIGSIENQSSILIDGDLIIANTSNLLENLSSGEIGDATLANQSLILNDADNILTNTSSLINSNTTIDSVVDSVKTVTDLLPDSGTLSSLGTLTNQSSILTDGDYTLANQTTIIANQSTILDNLGGDATLGNQSTMIQYNQTIDSVVDSVKTITDALPDSGTLTSIGSIANQSLILVDEDTIIANQSTILQFNQTIDNVVDTIRVVTDALPDAGALTSIGTIANQSLILVDGDHILSNTTSLINSNSTIDTIVDTILTNTTTILNDGDSIIANQTIIIANQSSILDSVGADATLANQSLIMDDGDVLITNTTLILQSNSTIDTVVDEIKAMTDLLPDSGALTSLGTVTNQSSILNDGDLIIANTSTIIDNFSSGEIGDATLANQSLFLSDGDNIIANTSSIIQTNSTIDSVVDTIETVTSQLPNAGALTDLAQVLNQSIIIANQSTILDTVGGDATLANQSVIIQFNQTIDNVVDDIKSITDLLPDSGALTSLGTLTNQSSMLTDGDNLLANTTSIIISNSTIDTVVDGIKTVTDILPDSGALTSIAQVLNQSIIIANQSTILDTSGGDATSTNQSAIIANQTLISDDIDLVIANTSSLIQTNSTIDSVVDAIQVVTDVIPDSGAMTSIGSIANQSLILTDGDNLIANTSSLIQTNTTIDNVVDTILTNTSSLLSNTTEVSGNYNLSTASGPHTVFTISVSERKRLASVFLDLFNLSYANNIKIDHKIDGTNYRTIVNTSWAITDDDGMYFNKNLAFTHDIRLTMSNGTSANATIPYYYVLESIE